MSLAFPRRLKQKKFEKPLLLYVLFNIAVQLQLKCIISLLILILIFLEAYFLS